jgi:hypothetical protein
MSKISKLLEKFNNMKQLKESNHLIRTALIDQVGFANLYDEFLRQYNLERCFRDVVDLMLESDSPSDDFYDYILDNFIDDFSEEELIEIFNLEIQND